MSIFSIDGESISSAYGKNGIRISQAYDIVGNELLQQSVGLKVMTYNVGQWYTGTGTNVPAEKDTIYYNLHTAIFENQDVDILVINEYWKQFSKLPRTALSVLSQFFPYIHEQGGDSGYFGRCICSKYPISNYTVRLFSGESRYYDTCTVTVNDLPITVCVTHFDPNSLSKRESEVSQLISFLQTQDYFICGGDLNTIDCRDETEVDYTNIIMPLLNAGFHIANCGDFGFIGTHGAGSSYKDNLSILDNIFTSGNIAITNAYADTTKITDGTGDFIDHLPLIATLQIGG